ncbi:protein THEM6-like [Littorina saxatilis]|uniref:protein THEM6-like n=1 Tax=Littorina saxatilis TaxID=31220 RepID=UPI0038B59E6B
MFSTQSQTKCWVWSLSCPAFNVETYIFWVTFFGVLVFIFCDTSFYLRSLLDWVMNICQYKPIIGSAGIRSTHFYSGRCMTTDMQKRQSSINCSASFLRECDFAFRVFTKNYGLNDALRHLGASLVNSSNNTKFRKSLSLLQSYTVSTRVVWWDNYSFYVEQKLVRDHDKVVCAVNFSRHTVEGASPQDLLDVLPFCSCQPEMPPPEIASWMVCINVVNRELQLAGH